MEECGRSVAGVVEVAGGYRQGRKGGEGVASMTLENILQMERSRWPRANVV